MHAMKRAPAAITSLSASTAAAPAARRAILQINPPNWNPVRNDRVLPHLGRLLILFLFQNCNHARGRLRARLASQDDAFADRAESVTRSTCGQNDGICHFDSDGFCRWAPELSWFSASQRTSRKCFEGPSRIPGNRSPASTEKTLA